MLIRIAALVFMTLLSGFYSSPVFAGDFNDQSSWAAFEPADSGVGDNPVGYAGAVFDGRYVYFVPFHNGTTFHGEVMRHDTFGSFESANSWSTFDPAAHGVGDNPKGYMEGVFDGRYVYFAPFHNGSSFHGEVLRYDTEGEFTGAGSWAAFEAGDNGVGSRPAGYNGAVFDGRHVYFVPFHNGVEYHGEVLRYDTDGDFGQASSWSTFDPSANGVGLLPKGYRGAAWDGRYIYFAPGERGSSGVAHGEVLCYDTTLGFSEPSSWMAFDPGSNGVGVDPDGYAGAVFDDRFVYFSPLHNGSAISGEVLRYDTTSPFAVAGSWMAFNPNLNGVGVDPDGYAGAIFDGTHVYFVPHYDSVSAQDEVLRLDTRGEFTDPAAWAAYDPVISGPDGRIGGVFDGKYVYFAPYHEPNEHGQVLRFETDKGAAGAVVEPGGALILNQNVPNPFNAHTSISYEILRDRTPARLEIFDNRGRLMVRLVDAVLDAGRYSVTWDGLDRTDRPVGSGLFHCRLSGPGFTRTRKIMLVK